MAIKDALLSLLFLVVGLFLLLIPGLRPVGLASLFLAFVITLEK